MSRINESYFKKENNMNSNTIEDIIDKDESILLRLKPNKKVFVLSSVLRLLPIALIWAAIDVFFIIQIASDLSAKDLLFIIPFFALHLFPVWRWIAGIVKAYAGHKNIEYVFTDKRILIRSGIIGIDFKSMFYSEIESVSARVGLLERIFKVGDIYILSTSQRAVLQDISNPYFILNRLKKITLDIKTDIYYPNDLRPDENHGYNTKYIKDFMDK